MNLIESKFEKIKSTYHEKIGILQEKRNNLLSCENKITSLTLDEDIIVKASAFLQSLSDQTRTQVLDKIAGIVTDALQTVKDKNLVFQMNLVIKANQPTLEMGILDKINGQVFDIINSFGGGICDIVSLVLRVALLVKWQPSLAKVIVLDEACKHVAVKDQELLSTFIRKLSEELSIQFIWISHSDVLQQEAHKLFEVTKYDGKSKVEEKTKI